MTYTVPSGVRGAITKIAVAAMFVAVPAAALSVPGYAVANTPAVLPAPPPADPPTDVSPPPAPPPAPPQHYEYYNPNDWYNMGADGGGGGGGG
jgi:hypothetical protein